MRKTAQGEGPKRTWKVTVSRTYRQLKTYTIEAPTQEDAEMEAIDEAQFRTKFPKDQRADEWTFVVRDVEEIGEIPQESGQEEPLQERPRRLPDRSQRLLDRDLLPEDESDLPLAASSDWDVREL